MKMDSHLFVVVGATGDLMRRKLLPALYQVFREQGSGGRSLLLGAAVETDVDDQSFRAMACKALADCGVDGAAAGEWCSRNLYYQTIGRGGPDEYRTLAARIEALEKEQQLPGNRVFYLALPPTVFPGTVKQLGQAGLNRSPGWTRVVVEKPFGHDLASARELNRLVHEYFEESQIYRIDHYLGKETVQNLLVFRFGNALFETVWNRDRIQKVDIRVAETLGVERRAAYYEQAGAVRDMIQNHVSQLMTIAAMELPASFESNAIRYEKVKVLKAVQPIRPEDVVFGQYTRGSIDGHDEPGYREEPGVAPDSRAETFAAIRLWIENWRWQGVPFTVRTGKRLKRRSTQVVVTFRTPPVSIFKPQRPDTIHSNVLIITIQPDEGLDLAFEVKPPGPEIRLETQRLHFRYSEAYVQLPDAYPTLLLDVVTGDQTLFVSSEWVEASWGLYTPLIESRPPVYPYPAGTWGPPEADRL